MQAIVLDVDDTTLTTWDYEFCEQLGLQPNDEHGIRGRQRTRRSPATRFRRRPECMVQMASSSPMRLGYAIFFITGRRDSQHEQTIANLVSDTAAGYPDLSRRSTIDVSGAGTPTVPEVDAGYPMADRSRHRS